MSQIVGTACRIASASNQHLAKTAGHTALIRAVQTQQVIPGLENTVGIIIPEIQIMEPFK